MLPCTWYDNIEPIGTSLRGMWTSGWFPDVYSRDVPFKALNCIISLLDTLGRLILK